MANPTLITSVAIAGNRKRTLTFTGVPDGADIFIAYFADGAVPSGTVFTETSGLFESTNSTEVIIQGSRKCTGVLRRRSVPAGNYTCEVDTLDTTFSIYGFYVGFVVPAGTLKNQVALDITTNTNSGFGNVATLVSSVLPAAKMLLIEIMLVGSATSPMNHVVPSGYTALFERQTSGEIIGSVNYRFVSVNTAQSLSHGTMAGSENWADTLYGFELLSPQSSDDAPLNGGFDEMNGGIG